MNFYCIFISGLLGFFIPQCFFYRSDYRKLKQKYDDLEMKYHELFFNQYEVKQNEQTNNKSNS